MKNYLNIYLYVVSYFVIEYFTQSNFLGVVVLFMLASNFMHVEECSSVEEQLCKFDRGLCNFN